MGWLTIELERIMELCLGTVQFGMDYGINGKKKPSMKECMECMDYAVNNGIRSIDTAAAYGNAEEVVGLFLKNKTIDREQLWISSKLLPNILDNCSPIKYREIIRGEVVKSLQILGTDYLDGYYFHSARYSFNSDMIEALYELQLEGLVKKIGVSVYETNEANACLESDKISIIQVPYSVFDHRMETAHVFELAKETKTEINVRSAFLQGLVLKNRKTVPPYLQGAADLVDVFQRISEKCGIDRVTLALAYVKKERNVSRLVFGIHSLDQLKNNVEAFNTEVPDEILQEIKKSFDDVSKQIVIPSLWKK